jgi:hypothetical protein
MVQLAAMAAQHHDSLVLKQAGTSPHRPGHQLRRSITEQPPPLKHHRVHQYLHRRHHERDGRTPLSAGPEVRGSLELPRTEAVTSRASTETNRMVLWGEGDAPNAGEVIASPRRSSGQDEATREQITDVEAAAACVTHANYLILFCTTASLTH